LDEEVKFIASADKSEWKRLGKRENCEWIGFLSYLNLQDLV